MAPLSWRHHTLLQALLTRGPLSDRDFRAVFAAISGKNPGTLTICLLVHGPRPSVLLLSPLAAAQLLDEMLLWQINRTVA
jgi:hypothetical protein